MNDIILWGLGLPAWITPATVITMFSLLLFTKPEADLVFVGGMTALPVTGTLPTKAVVEELFVVVSP